MINATNRDNVGQIDPRLEYDPASAARPAAARPRADGRDPVPAVGRRTIPVLSDPPPFVPFGAAHLGALACVALLALALVAPRAGPAGARPGRARGRSPRAIVVLVAFELAVGAREGWLGWKTLLPLELCDAAMVLAVVTLLVPRRRDGRARLLLGRLGVARSRC